MPQITAGPAVSVRTDTATGTNRAVTAGVFAVGCLVYLASLDFAASGDTIYYANIIDTLRLDQLSLHQGYYVVGLIFSKICGTLFGFSTDQSLVVMNAFFGAGMLAVAYPLLCRYLDSGRDALLGVVMLLASHRVFFNATMAEAYAMQTFLIWSSFLLFEKRRFYAAGFLIGLAMWTSPLTLFFCLWFPVVAWLRGFGVRPILQMAVTGALVYVPYFVVFYEELLWGTRGLLKIDSLKEPRPWLAATNFVKFQFKHYAFVNLLALPALVALGRERNLVWMTLALVVPNLYVVSQLYSEDHVFILTLDLIFVCWFMVGWRVLRERSLGRIGAACLAGQIVIFALAQHSLFRPANFDYGDDMREIGRVVTGAEDGIVLSDWARRMAYVYYNRAEPAFPLESGAWYEGSADVDDFEDTPPAEYLRHDAIFVIESYQPSGYSELYLGDDALAQRYKGNSVRRQAERYLALDCSEQVLSGVTPLYRCR